MASMSAEEQPILAESINEQPQAPRARWRAAAVAGGLAAGGLALAWARSGRPERHSGGFLDEVIIKAESEDAESCTTYMKFSGCDWTAKHNCPNQPAAAGSEGPAVDDGTIGYECCCKRTMWKSSNWKDSDDKGGEPEEQAPTFKLGTSGYAPYTYEVNGTWTGFAVEFARQMSDMCSELTIEVVETPWYDCWMYDDSGIGGALENVDVDACMSYTHTHGVRNEYADFSHAILKTNKGAGFLGRLDADGRQLVGSDTDLAGLRVVDVGGWAPTHDTLVMTTNKCTGQGFDASDFTLKVSVATDAMSANDAALKMLLNGEADLVYMYSDQPKNILSQCKKNEQDDITDCALWDGFGSTFAFIQTGMFGWVQNGTTLAMTKKGSGVNERLNPCIQQFMQSQEYYDLCVKYPSLVDDCYPNAHFPTMESDTAPHMMSTDDLASAGYNCSAGYCPCKAGSGGFDGFDCDAGLGNSKSGWSQEKKEWCCKSEGVACEEELFDCKAGLNNWERGWSEKKKDYCCKEKKLGCPEGEALPEEDEDDEQACKTTDGDECVFPFTYDGVTYEDCTSKDHHSAWCATRVDKDGNYIDERWGLCGSGCETDRPIDKGCKTTDGATCTFPFTYDGKTYSSCTKQDHHRAWCATLTDDSGNYLDGEWGHCSQECEEVCETMSGDKCVFPFTYKGTKYQYCTKMDHHSAWCATETDLKGNYVADKWGHCNRECEMQAGSECTTDDENKECVFPFVYQGIHFIGCTKKDHHSAWCATKTDREGNYVESAWGHCSEECQDRKACRATDDNECAFPFVYKGETFVSCTLKDHHSAWCATSTSSSGLVEEWGYCNEACEVCQTKDNAVCIFPFEYKGVTYTSCTDKDQHAAWCATDTDADGKFVVGQWGHCNPECQVCHTFNGAECVFPFTYDGREYKTCTDKNHSSAWCATQTDKTGGVKSWGHCRPQCEQEYDCSGSESKASWSPSKRAWCCDREDVGCEAMAVGVKSTSNSKVDTTTTAMTTETSRLKATSARESKASGEERNWTKSEHPYFAAVKESCTQDLKKYCSTKSFKDRSFLRAVNCLAEHRSNLDRKCADAAFSGTLENPHPKLFKIVNEGEEQECNITVHNDDGTISITPSTWRFVSGYVMAPLMYTTPSSTPIFNTWFSMVPALTQPAPKGIIFLHTGGPLPAMLQVAGAAFGDWFGKHTMYIRNNYDVVSVDQRGMGMSSLELLYGISPDTFSNYTWHEFATVMQGVAQNRGDLFSSVSIVVSDDKGNVTGESPCKQEETDHADRDENGFFAPWNFADEEQVDDWFTKKASVTKYCSDKFDKDDGEGETYSPLQYVGTGALTYDMEYMRLAFGGPKISLVGFSYGTRVAAAYASAFPYSTARMGVTGVMAPIPDLLEYAQKAADNTAEILGWIVSQCAQEENCSKNPWNRSESSEFFEGGIDEAVNELFNRSMDGGRWYTEHCGKNATPLSLKGLTQQFEGFLTTTQDPTQGMLTRYQNSTWPWGFAGLPAMVYALLNEPCFASTKFGLSNVMLSIMSSWSDISIFSLIPALDMTGRFDKIQAVKFLTTFASNPVFAPGLNMFILYASASYGWPQLPMPIGFSNQNVPAVIANGLYDERTGMAYAQDFKLHFPNSSLVTSLSGGHCVGYDQGAQAWELLVKFLINGTLPLDGTVTGEYIPIDFEMGRTVLMQGWRMIPPDEVV